MKIKPPRTSWQEGSLLIIKAFGGIPPDILEWELTLWNDLIKTCRKMIELEMKKGML